MNAVIYNFGRLKRLTPIVGTKRLASNRGLVGEPGDPPTGIDFRFGRSHFDGDAFVQIHAQRQIPAYLQGALEDVVLDYRASRPRDAT